MNLEAKFCSSSIPRPVVLEMASGFFHRQQDLKGLCRNCQIEEQKLTENRQHTGMNNILPWGVETS